MTIYPLSGASWPPKQQSSSSSSSTAVEEAHGYGQRRELHPLSCRSSLRQWELRKIASSPVLDADDYWSDASLSLPHLASALPQLVVELESKNATSTPQCSSSRNDEGARRCLNTQISSQLAEEANKARLGHLVKEPIKANHRYCAFPPPLDSPSPLICEGRYPSLPTLNTVCFTSVRSNGRLLITETPTPAQPRRCLRSQRCNGRLLLELYVESSTNNVDERAPETTAREELIASKDNPAAERARGRSPNVRNVRERGPIKKVEEEGEEDGDAEEEEEDEEEEEEEGGDKENGKGRLYSKVLKSLECDAFSHNSEESNEMFSPLQLQLKYGRRRGNGVASFLHKSLTRVRPLNMLSIWES